MLWPEASDAAEPIGCKGESEDARAIAPDLVAPRPRTGGAWFVPRSLQCLRCPDGNVNRQAMGGPGGVYNKIGDSILVRARPR